MEHNQDVQEYAERAEAMGEWHTLPDRLARFAQEGRLNWPFGRLQKQRDMCAAAQELLAYRALYPSPTRPEEP